MYCPNCGKAVDKALKYCNACGERLSKATDAEKGAASGKLLENILTTLFLIVMFGLGILVGLVAVLLGNGVRIEPVVVIVFAYLAAIFGICFTLVRQATKLIDFRLGQSQTSAEPAPRGELAAPVTGQLEEYRQPAQSVIEHTTRTLDKVPLKNG